MAERIKMPREERAKQFNPFNPLKGLNEALRMKEYEHERRAKSDISEEEMAELTETILKISGQDQVEIKFFADGHYFVVKGRCKVDFNEKFVEIDKRKISFDDIKKIKIL